MIVSPGLPHTKPQYCGSSLCDIGLVEVTTVSIHRLNRCRHADSYFAVSAVAQMPLH